MVRETRSTCPYCGVGCGVIIESTDDQITGVRGDPEHPANFGRLCSKGAALHHTATREVTLQTRLLKPMQRNRHGENAEPIEWDAALNLAVDRFDNTIKAHGPDSVGFYISGQLLTEDYYVFNKLAKGLIGTNNIDTNSRLCMSSAVAGYKQTLGADAPPACYDDLQHARTLFIAGSNTAWAHPVLYRRIEDARARRPDLRTVVVDPRRTETARDADLHLQILPGTDVMLFNALLHIMLWEGWIDAGYIARHTTGFDKLKTIVRTCTPDIASRVCGVSTDDLFTAARWFAGMDGPTGEREPTLSLYCQGLNQSSNGTANNAALIHLHLATGQLGKPGAGPFSLTGQPNAMGGREVGGLANLLSAHRDLANPQHRAEVAALWGVANVPATPGLTAVEMFQAAADGQLRALWIACTNPAQSMPDQSTVRRALERCDFVVVQEAFATTATCGFAHLLLPATTWGEKTGTVTNSERRISRVRSAVPPAGRARHDWAIASDFARRLEARLRPGHRTLFPYPIDQAERAVEQIWNEHRESTRGRDLDITGLSYAALDLAPRQWPFTDSIHIREPMGRARLYQDGAFPTTDGRARFIETQFRPLAEPRDARHPFSLNTGRLRDQWHGMSRTGTSARLFSHAPEPVVQLHRQDMARRHLAEGDLVQVSSRRGSVVLPVQASDDVAPAQAFIAMHWGSEFLGGRSAANKPAAGINGLTVSAYCPISKQPELKHAAVKVLKAELPWQMVAQAWLGAGQALEVQARLRGLMSAFAFASCVPVAGTDPHEDPTPLHSGADNRQQGLLLRLAAEAQPDRALIERIEQLLGLDTPGVLCYEDRKRAQRRVMRLVTSDGEPRLTGFALAGDVRAHSWLRTLLEQRLSTRPYGRLLLAPGAQPPAALPVKGKTVCSCINVGEIAILDRLPRCVGEPAERLAQLQEALSCGTQCGSCIPELRRLIMAIPPAIESVL